MRWVFRNRRPLEVRGSFVSPLRRLFDEHGVAMVLLLMSSVLTLITIEEQQPGGRSAGLSVVSKFEAAGLTPSLVLVVADDSPGQREFAAASVEQLNDLNIDVLGPVHGSPREVRLALDGLIEQGQVPQVIWSLRTSDAWSLLEGSPERVPELGATRVLAPSSYRWSTFLTRANLLNVAEKISVWAILGIGMTLVIITAGIDLSVGSLVALSSVVTATLIRDFLGAESAGVLGVGLASLAGVLVCGLIGLFTGWVVTRWQVAPFIVTLAMMMAASGLALKLTNGESVDKLPPSFAWLGHGDVLGVPNPILVMLLLYAAAYLLMHHTTLGRAIYAVGGNREAARLSGVPVRSVLIFVYVLSGLMAGIGGVITASTFESGDPNYGLMYELYVIAAVVVGGTTLMGGQGKVMGTLAGALTLGVIYNGMNLTNVGGFSQRIVLGIVILAAVILDQLKRKR